MSKKQPERTPPKSRKRKPYSRPLIRSSEAFESASATCSTKTGAHPNGVS